MNFEEIALSTKLPSDPESLKWDANKETRNLYILERPRFLSIRADVKGLQRLVYEKKVILGPAGAGKSLLLYCCALDAINSNQCLYCTLEYVLCSTKRMMFMFLATF